MALPQGFGPRRSFADVQRQQLANQLLAQGGDASPVAHPMQGVARLAQALMGGYMTNRNEQRENDQQQAFSQAVTEAMQPQFVPGSAGAGPRSGPQGATMAPPSFGDVAQRLAANPATAHIAPQFQMMGLQQQAADAAKRADPMFGRVNVRDVGLLNLRDGTPRVEVPVPQKPDEFERLAAAAGLKPGTPEFAAAARAVLDRRGAAPSTTVNAPVTVEPPKYETRLQQHDADRIRDAENALQQARRLLPDLDRLEAAIKVFPTGMGGSGVLAFRQAMERIGVPVQGTSEGEIIQSIQSRLAPAMRPEGSGSSSNMDVQMFMDSLPNLFRTQGGNMAIIRHMRHITQRQQREAVFMRDYMRKNGSLGGVYEAMDAELGPVFPRVNTPEEADKLPQGSLFVDPTGVMRVR